MEKTCRTCKHTDPGCLMRIRGRRGLDCYYYEARETPLLVDALAEALRIIQGEPQAQLQYLETHGVNALKAKGGWVMTPKDCKWVGDFETDARHTYPNQWRLVSAIVQAALARYKEEVGDAQD